ncbi:MAG: nucleoside-diphosphate kinase [Porphyromonadaceae bacterium]|nr:nucleoside-diphosphate kinase [Porphyromonadaceae bacterium]
MQKTLVLIKPGAIQRELIGEVLKRFENKGFRICGLKMIHLTEDILRVHYAHLVERPFFARILRSMMATPVIALCLEGVEAVKVVRDMIGVTNGREAQAGTIRGDFSLSNQENIIHASDSVENAAIEIKRFFLDNEIFSYTKVNQNYINYSDELI